MKRCTNNERHLIGSSWLIGILKFRFDGSRWRKRKKIDRLQCSRDVSNWFKEIDRFCKIVFLFYPFYWILDNRNDSRIVEEMNLLVLNSIFSIWCCWSMFDFPGRENKNRIESIVILTKNGFEINRQSVVDMFRIWSHSSKWTFPLRLRRRRR